MNIIIELPPDLSAEGTAYILATVANEIGCGAIALSPYIVSSQAVSVDGWSVVVTVDGGKPHPAANVVNHPPLNTPLSAFTPEMLERLPVGSAFGETDTNGGVVEKHADGWHYRDRTACADFPIGYNQSRPLIRVGPEQASEPAPVHTTGRLLRDFTIDELRALPTGSRFGPTDDGEYFIKGRDGVWRVRMTSLAEEGEDRMLNMWGTDEPPLAFVAPGEPAPLPDPWPGMVARVHVAGLQSVTQTATIRKVRTAARELDPYTEVWYDTDTEPTRWEGSRVVEVRTPDGVVVWKRSGPRPLSTYTEEDRRTFPVGTTIGIYTKLADALQPVGEVWRAADGMTLMGAYVADAMSRSGDMLVHFPAKVTT